MSDHDGVGDTYVESDGRVRTWSTVMLQVADIPTFNAPQQWLIWYGEVLPYRWR